MLDIAEQCFMRIADLLQIVSKTVRQVFLKYSLPEQFKDGSVLELMSPSGFLEGIKDIGFDDVTELEAACLMKVLAKPELDNSVILNEFVLIMENFGVPVVSEEEEYENDYIPDSEDEEEKEPVVEGDDKKKADKTKKKNSIQIKFEVLDEKGTKILKKLARFLLERYMHPREFFGPTIKKEIIGKRKCKVEVIKLHDFYLRIKLASIRKKLKENVTLNQFLAIDGEKFAGFVQVKRLIKSLEVVAEGEQEQIVKEQEEKLAAEMEKREKEELDRKEKGLPPLTEEEYADEKKAGDKKGKDFLNSAGVKQENLGEVLKLGGKISPKGEKEEKKKTKYTSSTLGVPVQLNTIEEDLHETQTSHYSYQVKEGDHSERATSRHGLSNSNNLRNSNTLHEVDDQSRRSANMIGGLPMGHSVQSGDYSGGSQGSSSKMKARDIDNNNDISIEAFLPKKKADKSTTDRPHHITDSLKKYSIKEEMIEDDLAADKPRGAQTTSQSLAKDPTDDYDIDLEEVEQKMQQELEAEVDKQYSRMQEDEDDYSDEEFKEDKLK